MTLPNCITLLRVVLSLACFVFAMQQRGWLQILVIPLYITAALTDLLDGYLARLQKRETTLGKILDPIADKIQTLPPFVFFSLYGLYSFWWIFPILVREIVITSIRLALLNKGRVIAAEKSGKLKTFLQHISIIVSYLFFLAMQPAFRISEGTVTWNVLCGGSYFLMWCALAMTILSGISFFKNLRSTA